MAGVPVIVLEYRSFVLEEAGLREESGKLRWNHEGKNDPLVLSCRTGGFLF